MIGEPGPAYDVDPLGYVHLRGLVERDSGGDDTAIVLPAGARPATVSRFITWSEVGSAGSRGADGRRRGDRRDRVGDHVALDGITFRAALAGPVRRRLPGRGRCSAASARFRATARVGDSGSIFSAVAVCGRLRRTSSVRSCGHESGRSPSATAAGRAFNDCLAAARPVGQLDLDDHRQHHRPPLEAPVDELGEVVVEVGLEQRDLPHAVLGRPRERLLDRAPQLLDDLLGVRPATARRGR